MAECAAAAAAPAAIAPINTRPRVGPLTAACGAAPAGPTAPRRRAAPQVAPVRCDQAFGAGLGLAGAVEIHDDEIVGVVQVVEFGGPQDLRFFVECGVVAEVQVVEVTDSPNSLNGMMSVTSLR